MSRVLVIQLARMGDLLQTVRLIRSIQADHDLIGGELHLCVDRSLAALARLHYPQTEVHAIAAHGAGTSAADVAGNLAAFARLRAIGFERVYNLNFSGLNFALASLFPAERVRGYRVERGQRLKDPALSGVFRMTARRRESAVNLIDAWTALHERPAPPQSVHPDAAPKGGGIGVALAGRNSRRSLPPPVLAAVVEVLAAKQPGAPVHLLGSAGEAPLARALAKRASPGLAPRLNDLSGKTDWKKLREVVGGLDLLITPDTGLMHLAASLGTPVVAFFLSSAWVFETGPYGRGHFVWQADAPCAPCLESAPCAREVACLSPFAAREFPRLLALGPKAAGLETKGLTGYASELDALGASYRPVVGAGVDDGELLARRRVAADNVARGGEISSSLALGFDLFRETDGCLPGAGFPFEQTEAA